MSLDTFGRGREPPLPAEFQGARCACDSGIELSIRHRPLSSLGDLSPAEFAERCIPSASPTAQLQEYDQAI